MLIAVLSGFFLAAFVPWLFKRFGEKTSHLLALLPAALFVYFLTFLPAVTSEGRLLISYEWVPLLGISLNFWLDGLSLLFALLISGIGFFVIIYTGSYLAHKADQRKLLMYLMAFMAAMLGVVLSSNLMAMFVFWELTSITSYMLIGYYHEKESSRKSALQGLMVTVGGGLALLAGIIMLGLIAGTYEVREILAQGTSLQSHPLFPAMMVLVLLGAFTKSAQFPFHFWLPNAMAAPTPVSSYLHSATMVKAGVYLMARLQPTMAGYEAWTVALTFFGATTMLLGATLAVTSTDLKRILAYSTVMALGTLTMLIGIGTEASLVAAVVFLLGHALYKGALFMAAGTIDHEAGTKDVRELGGLRKAMPYTAAFMSLAALALTGVPPLFGFIGKELMLEGVLSSPWAVLLIFMTLLTSVFIVVCAGLLVIKPFWGEKKATPKEVHEAPMGMRLGFSVLATVGLIFGLMPSLVTPLVSSAVSAISFGQIESVDLALWHGINLPLMISVAALGLGYLLFKKWDTLGPRASTLKPMLEYGPERGYEIFMDNLVTFAKWSTMKLQNGYMANYILTIFITTIALVAYAMFTKVGFHWDIDFSDVTLKDVGISILIIAVITYACMTPLRLGAVAAIGALGFSMALIYVFFSAPDLAITQVLIETLTVIMLVLVLFRLPKFQKLSSSDVRWRDCFVAVTFGVMMAVLLLTVTHFAMPDRISSYLIENSYTIAKGRNIVNVILVDYRALDTLGELFVLSLAAIGVTAMLRTREEK
ncbi:putative monovalent cation/H+ antiporter subunit A [Vibrio genomosp. F10 str. 9ZC157]|uniref:putative monovalent cation/H+ antiporter subunit A n=1 Tax=Vibrio genomosp. F10 TaxID=723171 RepID=UPI0003091151|nr:putative monovalent cation/H+ antiporter subunit A [Vibrio genomosp. F10]OEE98388.1 Na(+)/H(+) antiporter subunit A [Vibrio genomosp. F10 str. 9ZC157]